MKIHEYQAKAILKAAGVPVLEGRVVHSAQGAGAAFAELGQPIAVVKAQIHAGGRGKGGGVKLVRSVAEAEQAAAAIMAKPLITYQTGPNGQRVKTLLVEQGCAIERELYAGIALDRASRLPVLMVSSEGGVEIEEVAHKHPEKILKETIDPLVGLLPSQARRLAKEVGLPATLWDKATQFLQALCRVYIQKDLSLAEINPLVVTKDGQLIALDAKMNFDSNALYRQPDVVALRDLDEEDASEVAGQAAGISYISLDGNIGCLVNGAGLAMATMDIIKLYGASPANFLDVGGGATKDQVATAFRLILADPKVKGILINIFGGILRCTTLADGIVAAVKETGLSLPLVVRLEGTEVEQGRQILRDSGLPITTASTMADAAEKIVKATAQATAGRSNS
ncbi:MAG: ADP-forming succinate--CoA ligase subunit beta [Planctomycetes bacterium]|nr:ADP-forming succinate--CoA ligase subunit beta [Planctomycetota bacterium]